MVSSGLQAAVLREISLVPEDKLTLLLDLIHYFRLGLEASRPSIQSTLEFAGCWSDLPEQDFAEFTEEILNRRQQAFSRRRSDEASPD